jgi:predicted component of type VI protein secretion system
VYCAACFKLVVAFLAVVLMNFDIFLGNSTPKLLALYSWTEVPQLQSLKQTRHGISFLDATKPFHQLVWLVLG